MKKKIIISVISIFIGYVLYTAFTIVKYMHHFDTITYKNYSWLLKDSIKKRINPYFSGSNARESDVYNFINYDDSYIKIWEFKDLKSIRLKDVSFNLNIGLSDIRISSGETLNKNANPQISIKYGFNFNNTFYVNLDEASKIIKTIDSTNYKGFYGIINKMSFSDGKGEHLILFNYPKGAVPTLFLLYKTADSFFVIMIESDKAFDENIINVLNLK